MVNATAELWLMVDARILVAGSVIMATIVKSVRFCCPKKVFHLIFCTCVSAHFLLSDFFRVNKQEVNVISSAELVRARKFAWVENWCYRITAISEKSGNNVRHSLWLCIHYFVFFLCRQMKKGVTRIVTITLIVMWIKIRGTVNVTQDTREME